MTDHLPEVGVACAWYNRADYLRGTLDSLLGQAFDSFEIVVVNDGSPDPRVREILDSYNDPRLRVIHQDNMGFVHAIRRAIDASATPFIAIQGAGDIALTDRLRRQWEALQAEPSAAMAGCFYDIENTVSGARSTIRPRAPAMGDLRFRGLSHGELMYRRDVYRECGGYRPIFRVGQGADMWMRLLRRHGAVIVPETLYVQRLFPDGVAMSAEKLAARRVMNAIRVENEISFRKTGIDHIDTYGAAAFSILGRRGLSRQELVATRMHLQSDADSKDVRMARLEWPIEAEAALRTRLREGRRWIGRLRRNLLHGST